MHYLIQPRETISDLVNKFDVTFDLIRRFNNFVEKETGIYSGRVINLPLRYTALPGDTYEIIAKKFILPLEQLHDINKFGQTTVIYPGQTVMLPPTSYRFDVSAQRETTEEHIVTTLKKKEEYEEETKPVFTTDAGFLTLTFDDGPSIYTERILAILAEKDVRAIFFMIGENVAKYRDAARKVVEAGHLVGNHSYTHPFFTKISPAQQDAELKKTSDLIADVTGVGPRYFRPPYGSFNESTLNLSLKDNMKVVMWSADPRDYSFNTPNAVYGATEPLIASRKILLLHEVKAATYEALPRIIDYVREKKLTVTKEYEH